MSYNNHALTEFRAAKWVDQNGAYYDNMQELMCTQVLELLTVFSGHGHSGSTAPYAIALFEKLAKFEPLTPLTGEDWEWHDISESQGGEASWQNIRASNVFKGADGSAYDINGTVFYNWDERPLDEDEDGYPGTRRYKSYYTCKDSRTAVTFPYTPVTKYIEADEVYKI